MFVDSRNCFICFKIFIPKLCLLIEVSYTLKFPSWVAFAERHFVQLEFPSRVALVNRKFHTVEGFPELCLFETFHTNLNFSSRVC